LRHRVRGRTWREAYVEDPVGTPDQLRQSHLNEARRYQGRRHLQERADCARLAKESARMRGRLCGSARTGITQLPRVERVGQVRQDDAGMRRENMDMRKRNSEL
jgi:hypothetical protein